MRAITNVMRKGDGYQARRFCVGPVVAVQSEGVERDGGHIGCKYTYPQPFTPLSWLASHGRISPIQTLPGQWVANDRSVVYFE